MMLRRRRFLHQHQRERLTDDVTAPNDNGMFSRPRNTVTGNELHDTVRRTRVVTRVASGQSPDVFRVKAIDVLQRCDRVNDGLFADRLRERKLNQNAVNRRVRIESIDHGEELLF